MSVTFGSGYEKLHIQMSPFTFPIQLSPTPTVLFCRFSSGGTSVVVTFASSTDRGQLSNTQSCSAYIENSGALGNGCRSSWTTDKELQLLLGAGATLVPGDILNLKRNVIRAYLSSSLYVSGSINVVAPFLFPVNIVLLSPAEISHCHDIVLDATSSSGSCGRAFAVSWFVSLSAKRADEIQKLP